MHIPPEQHEPLSIKFIYINNAIPIIIPLFSCDRKLSLVNSSAMAKIILSQVTVKSGKHWKIIDTDTLDLNLTPPQKQYDTLHISFPYSTSFVASVKKYQKQYGLINNHSFNCSSRNIKQIKRGTLTSSWSPSKSRRRDRTFIKLFAEQMRKSGRYIYKKGLRRKFSTSLKRLKLPNFGIRHTTDGTLFFKRSSEVVQKNKLDFEEVYTFHNQNYNTGYEKLGKKMS